MSLVDIGMGLKLFVPSGADSDAAGEGKGEGGILKNLLQMQQLVDAPIKSALDRAQLVKAKADVENVPLDRATKVVDLKNKELDGWLKTQEESRKQIEFTFTQLKRLPEMLNMGFPFFAAGAQKMGLQAVDRGPDGAALIVPGDDGGIDIHTINPRVLTDPQVLATETMSAQDKWVGTGRPGEQYNEIYTAWRQMTGAIGINSDHFNPQDLDFSKLDISGSDDTALFFTFMKILDPGSRVTEGELDLSKEAATGSEKWALRYNKWTASGGKGRLLSNEMVRDMIGTSRKVWQARRDLAITRGLGLGESHASIGMDPNHTVPPVGDLNWRVMQQENKLRKQGQIPPSLQSNETQQRLTERQEALSGGVPRARPATQAAGLTEGNQGFVAPMPSGINNLDDMLRFKWQNRGQ